jgi:hypothetical protein
MKIDAGRASEQPPRQSAIKMAVEIRHRLIPTGSWLRGDLALAG